MGFILGMLIGLVVGGGGMYLYQNKIVAAVKAEAAALQAQLNKLAGK